MIKILRSHQFPTMGRGPFQIRRMKPGMILDLPTDDPVFGPFSVLDHGGLAAYNTVPMHEHRNDEILTYQFRGGTTHTDSSGHVVPLGNKRLMLMNAGSGFSHEETTSSEEIEGLQIFIRPRKDNLSPNVQFYDRPIDYKNGKWQLLAGPESSDAPLKFRNEVMVYDVHAGAGVDLTAPVAEGMSPYLYVMDGTIQVGEHTLHKGDAFTVTENNLAMFRTASQATIVVFLASLKATGSKLGTISGM